MKSHYKVLGRRVSVQSSCIFIGIVTAGFIYVPAILVIIVKWLFGIG